MDYENLMRSPILDEIWEKQKDEIQKYDSERENYTEKEKQKLEKYIKEFFKLGILTGVKLKNDLKESINNEEGFYEYEYSGFTEYLETTKINNLMNREDYNELRKKQHEIKAKYPKAMELLEDRSIVDKITEDDQKAMLELMEIQDQIHILEEKEIYRMGMKEMSKILYK